MAEQNQNPHPEAGGERSADNGAGKNRRHRHHRHHRGHNNRPTDREGNLPKTENAEAVKPEATTPAEKPHTDKEHKKPDHRKDGKNGNQQNNQNATNGNGHNNKKGDRHHGQKNRHQGGNRSRGPESRPYDPYETPSRQEIELSELRAQIVLKSADGSVPTAYTPAAAPAPVREQEPKVELIGEETIEEALPEADAPVQDAPTDAEPAEEVPMVEVVGIRFRSAGKMYYFDPNGIKVKKGDNAIVETTRGPEFGDVCLENTMIRASNTVSPLRPLIRLATPADVVQNAQNREKEKNAIKICQEKIEKHGLEMKLIDVQYAFDGSKLLFYFAAEGRVDFRELVKDLASVFRTRIELRQIGIRDEAKMLGGIGACGRPLCCSTFLPDFAQVSIKMAKDQNLSLNSSKISGVCGRLMCCLRYESEVYAEEIRKTPSNDTLVRTEDGVGVVIGSTPLSGMIRVVLKDNPDTAPKMYHRDSVTVLGKEKKGGEASKAPETAE